MKKIFSILVVLSVIITVFTGCSRNHAEEIQSLIDELEQKIETITNDADTMQKKGVIEVDLYNQVQDLQMKFNENKELFAETTGKSDKKILKALKECKETVNELQLEIDSIYEGYDEVRNYNLELATDAGLLAEYMEEGLSKGYIDRTTMDEFNGIRERLEQLKEELFPDEFDKAELDSLKERLAVMSSQCAAPNAMVDIFAAAGSSLGETEEETEVSNNENSSSSEDNNDIQTLTDNFTLLQNEASQNFDKGVISEEQYMAIIEAGTKLAELKENIEKNGESSSTDKELEKCKNEIHDIAVEIKSSLAEKFE